MNDTTRLEKTKAGLQGILITEQRTQKRLGAIKSNIPLAKQIAGTMFEPEKPNEPTLFDNDND